ncbi:MAG: hypothetical protein AAFR04_05630 [Pseudomonadota bacterium]
MIPIDRPIIESSGDAFPVHLKPTVFHKTRTAFRICSDLHPRSSASAFIREPARSPLEQRAADAKKARHRGATLHHPFFLFRSIRFRSINLKSIQAAPASTQNSSSGPAALQTTHQAASTATIRNKHVTQTH